MVAVRQRGPENHEREGDREYAEMLAGLSTASVRRSFNAYADVDWDAPELAVTDNDPRWVLGESDHVGRHPWYKAQPLDKQIAIGMWRQANTKKAAMHFESILTRGILHYAFELPNGSPEFRYCLHESVEECHHSMMFQEAVNRIGADVPGMSRWLRRVSPVVPLIAGAFPNLFFFGVLAGEEPFHFDHRNTMREGAPRHPIVERVTAIHVAEEARHISFAHEFLRKRIPRLSRASRFVLSLQVPVVMRFFGVEGTVRPPRRFFETFAIPPSVERELFFDSPDARQVLRDMFADIRMLCEELGLMNRVARLVWRLCKVDGQPSRYRSEPQREHLPSP